MLYFYLKTCQYSYFNYDQVTVWEGKEEQEGRSRWEGWLTRSGRCHTMSAKKHRKKKKEQRDGKRAERGDRSEMADMNSANESGSTRIKGVTEE